MVSAAVVTILILMIAIALSALAYTFFTRVFTEVTTSGTAAISRTTATITTLIKVESANYNKIYIRNIGQTPLTGFIVYLNEQLVNSSTTEPVSPGSTAQINLSDYIEAAECENNKIRITTAEGTTASYTYDNVLLFCEDFAGSFREEWNNFIYGNDGTPKIVDTIFKDNPNSMYFNRTTQGHSRIRSRYIPITPGSKIIKSGWLRRDNVVQGSASWQSAYGLGRFFNSSFNELSGARDIGGGQGTVDWTYFKTTHTAPSDAAYYRINWIGLYNAAGAAWWDDIKVAMED